MTRACCSGSGHAKKTQKKTPTNQTDSGCYLLYRQASNPFVISPGRQKNLHLSCHPRSETQLQDGQQSSAQRETSLFNRTQRRESLCHHFLHQPLVNGQIISLFRGHSKLHFAGREGLILHGHRAIAAQDCDAKLLLPLQGLRVPLMHHQ